MRKIVKYVLNNHLNYFLDSVILLHMYSLNYIQNYTNTKLCTYFPQTD